MHNKKKKKRLPRPVINRSCIYYHLTSLLFELLTEILVNIFQSNFRRHFKWLPLDFSVVANSTLSIWAGGFFVPSVVIWCVTCHTVAYVSEDYPAEACVARVSLTLFSFLHILYDYIVIYTCMTCTSDYVSFSVAVV